VVAAFLWMRWQISVADTIRPHYVTISTVFTN
jgi:hypothetical protein